MAKCEALNHERRPRGDDGKLQAVSVIRCSECSAEGLFWVGLKYSDNIAFNKFHALGWRMDRKTATCPACIQAKHDKERAASLERAKQKRDARIAAPLVELGNQLEGIKAVMSIAPKVVDMKTGAAPDIVDGGIIRELSREQKANVRRKLDEYFDDSRGTYLDGMSDQEVARACGVPSANVAQIRVSAYGPLRQPSIAPDLQKIVGMVDDFMAKEMAVLVAARDGHKAAIVSVQSCTAKLDEWVRAMQGDFVNLNNAVADCRHRLAEIKKAAESAIKTLGVL